MLLKGLRSLGGVWRASCAKFVLCFYGFWFGMYVYVATGGSSCFRLNLASRRILRDQRGCNTGLLAPPGHPSLLGLCLRGFRSPIMHILLVTTMFSLVVSIVRGRCTRAVNVVTTVLLTANVNFCFRCSTGGGFSLLGTIGRRALMGIVHGKHVRRVPHGSIMMNSVIMLRANRRVPTSNRLVRTVSLRIGRSGLAKRPIVGGAVVRTSFSRRTACTSGLIVHNAAIISNRKSVGMLHIKSTARVKGITHRDARRAARPAPLGVRLAGLTGLVNGVNFAMTKLTFLVFFVGSIMLCFSFKTLGN